MDSFQTVQPVKVTIDDDYEKFHLIQDIPKIIKQFHGPEIFLEFYSIATDPLIVKNVFDAVQPSLRFIQLSFPDTVHDHFIQLDTDNRLVIAGPRLTNIWNLSIFQNRVQSIFLNAYHMCDDDIKATSKAIKRALPQFKHKHSPTGHITFYRKPL